MMNYTDVPRIKEREYGAEGEDVVELMKRHRDSGCPSRRTGEFVELKNREAPCNGIFLSLEDEE